MTWWIHGFPSISFPLTMNTLNDFENMHSGRHGLSQDPKLQFFCVSIFGARNGGSYLNSIVCACGTDAAYVPDSSLIWIKKYEYHFCGQTFHIGDSSTTEPKEYWIIFIYIWDFQVKFRSIGSNDQRFSWFHRFWPHANTNPLRHMQTPQCSYRFWRCDQVYRTRRLAPRFWDFPPTPCSWS